MHKQQSPQHPEFWESVVASLHCPHPLLSIETNPNVRSLYHGHIVCPIADRQGDFVKVLADDLHNLRFLNGE